MSTNGILLSIATHTHDICTHISVVKAQSYLITLRHHYYHLIFIVEILICPHSVMKNIYTMLNSFRFRHCLCVTRIEIQTNRSDAICGISVRTGTEFVHSYKYNVFRTFGIPLGSKWSFDVSESECHLLVDDCGAMGAAYYCGIFKL